MLLQFDLENKPKEYIRILAEEIGKELFQLGEVLSGQINTNTPSGAGEMLRGSFIPRKFGEGIEVGSPMEYGQYVEFGTSPHKISREGFESLVLWVEAKRLDQISRFVKTGKTTRASNKIKKGQNLSPRQKAIRSIAFAIRNKIREHGTKAKFMMKRAFDSAGIKYVVVSDALGKYYVIDAVPIIEQRANKIDARIQARMK